jgi:hypothetical protein
MDTNELSRPAPWKETLFALIPFLLLPILFLFGLLLSPLIQSTIEPAFALGIALALIGGFIVAMLVGWMKSFPRWVFPYWGFIVLITLYMRGFSGTIFGFRVDGDWWAWAPVIAVAIIGTLWARNLEPVYTLLKSFWKDWTLLSFAFYGALPLLFLFAYDEVHNQVPYVAISILILVAGAAIYMRAENVWHRFVSLVGGFTIGWTVLMIHLGIYWNGRQLFWMTKPGSWIETLDWTSRMGAVILLIIVAPVLVEFLRWWVSIGRTLKAAD